MSKRASFGIEHPSVLLHSHHSRQDRGCFSWRVLLLVVFIVLRAAYLGPRLRPGHPLGAEDAVQPPPDTPRTRLCVGTQHLQEGTERNPKYEKLLG